MAGIGGPTPALRGRDPALDGLRGVAIVAVLVFHADGLLPGGYIGVSTFFTLSGFLITSTSLDADRSARGFTAWTFYARRIRRLAPAATICFLGIFWLEWQFQAFARGPLRSESTWAVAQLYNWKVLLANRSYEQLFTATATPFMHFWSLAIEEQFYLLFPLIILVHRRTANDRRFLTYAIGAFLTTATLAVLIAAVFGPDAAYYATPARATEIIAGVALALIVRGGWLPRWAGALAPAGFVVLLVAMVVTPDRTAAWTYHGGFAVIAVLSALAIVAALGPGPVRRLLQSAPLVFLGTISYGLYLFHWPIYLLLQSRYPESDAWQLLAIGSLLAVGVATLSYTFVERPIVAMALLPRRAVAGLAAPLLAVAAIGLLLPVERRAEPVTTLGDIDQGQLQAIALRPTPAPSPATTPTTTPGAAPSPATTPTTTPTTTPGAAPTAPPGPTSTATPAPSPGSDPGPGPDELSLLVVGDSTAVALGAGLVDHVQDTAADARLDIEASGSCGILSGGHYADPVLDSALQMTCPGLVWHDAIEKIGTTRPRIVIVLVTLADSWSRSWDDGATWLRATDEEFISRLRADYERYVTAALDAGARCVAWIRPPTSALRSADGRLEVEESFADGSQDAIGAVVSQLAAEHPDRMTVLDFEQYFSGRGRRFGDDGRPDGIHMTSEAATAATRDWLWPALLELGQNGRC